MIPAKRTYTVYEGYENGLLVYIGTTIQKPEDRFRWHKSRTKAFKGKTIVFKVLNQFDNEKDMLDLEFDLIKKLKPKYNNRKTRQNLNVKLTQLVLDTRKGDPAWCQCCLKRRAKKGYRFCYWCN